MCACVLSSWSLQQSKQLRVPRTYRDCPSYTSGPNFHPYSCPLTHVKPLATVIQQLELRQTQLTCQHMYTAQSKLRGTTASKSALTYAYCITSTAAVPAATPFCLQQTLVAVRTGSL
eukprot:2214-Heterococcus_DN1.PRE.4